MQKIRTVIIDDDQWLCESLKTILSALEDIEVAGMGFSGREAISLYTACLPDVILMDIRMTDMSGLEAGEIILDRYKRASILYLTTFLDDEYIVRALNMGAKGYLIKQDIAGIAPALRAVYSGQSVFGSQVSKRAFSLARAVNKPLSKKEILKNITALHEGCNVSERELDVMMLIAKGFSNKEIATKLFLSEGTVRNYISILLDKLYLRDRTQIAIFWFEHFA